MANRYARLNDLGGNLGTEADPFTTLGAALAVSSNGDRILLAGDGTEDPFLDQLDLDPFHTIAVVQWPGQPQAHIDFRAGVGGTFDQATVKKDGGWAQGGLIELEGFHIWNNQVDQDNAFCVVLQNCDQATQKLTYDCVIRQNTAARGLMIIQPSAGTFEITGEVWDAVGSPGGNGRCLYITGQDGGLITVDPFKILRCATDDHAAYCSVQLSGKTVLDNMYVEQFGMGQAFCMWLKDSGTLHVLRSHFSYPSIGGFGFAVLLMDSTVGTGETIFERVEVDTLRDCDPAIPWRTAVAVLSAPDLIFRNCTLVGDYMAIGAGDSFFGPPMGSTGLEVTNSIMVVRSLNPVGGVGPPGLIWIDPDSVEGTSFDGNCYYMISPHRANPFRVHWNDTEYTDFRTWKMRARQDSNSYLQNPGLLNILNGVFDLTRESVCIDAGILTDLITEVDRRGRTAQHLNPASAAAFGMSAIDIGAMEYDPVIRPGTAKPTRARYGTPEYGLRRDGGAYLRGWNL
jgi:hypothetical protein